ncbi:hypothetical protein PtB15_5B245 [Puccinia triticina]|nr:hypothetical protein PtB15_5B245 [Puccinia triticina]
MLPKSYSSPFVLLVLSAVSISLLWRRFGPFPEIQHGNSSVSYYSSARKRDAPKENSALAKYSALETRPSSNFLPQNEEFLKTARLKRGSTPSWSLLLKGTTGVSAQQISVVGEKYALIIDKVEHNPLMINGRPAWAALYNLETDEVTPLSLKSNSFCAGGSYLSNGTLLNIGGDTPEYEKAEFGDTNGLQSIRFYTPCDDGKCAINEYDNIKLTTARWYPTSARLPDGSVIIVGGSTEGAFRNSVTINNPTIEYYPPKSFAFSSKSEIYSPFLNRSLVTNLFPIVIVLPIPETIFIAANNDAMLYNWKTNTESPLPPFPNGVRVTYPFTGSGLLLPLSPLNGYTPEVLVCGGTNLDDRLPVTALKVSDPASAQCARMVLTTSGIREGWKVEQMPSPRIMPDLIMMPDGKVLIVNGAKTGVSGYGDLDDKVGDSNADNPNFTPVLYDPTATIGQRFNSQGMPTSNIPRLYHSVATLVPSGEIMIAGSNPNQDVTTQKYPTEYRVEWLLPPYLNTPSRPVISEFPRIANYNEHITLKLGGTGLDFSKQCIEAVLLDLGFVTHSVHMDSRLVRMETLADLQNNVLKVVVPPSPEIYPPGYAWIHVLVDGIPSTGKKIMIGSGKLNV